MISKLGKGLEAIIPGFKENALYDNEDIKNIVEVEIKYIIAGIYQPRKNFDEQKLKELANSIKEKGIIQPLVVVKDENEGKYKLIAGERRYRAAIIAKLTKVPIIIKNYTDDERLEIALIENLQREDLNVIEEAQTYKILMDKYNLTQEEIGKKFQKSRPYITNTLRLLNLSDNIKNLVIENKISSIKARTLLSVEDENFREKLAENIINNDLSVKQIDLIIKQQKNQNNNIGDIRQQSQDEKLKIFLDSLYEKFEINKNKYFLKISDIEGCKGSVNIKFNSEEELKNILKKIIE
ncbi:MAG: ParB/RepB/Spo0J family partition protein [Elusimicrobiota bacterium]|jgi:ParB family chromosome partitioning protein|nr:ParB/RepB/Spo0J family partition protein [Elusimicrobiota bacterium]